MGKVDKCSLDECWNWLAYLDKDGYGGFNIDSVQRKAHRVAYVLANGKLKTSLLVCHSCDNPSCVNPAHLWAGTSRQNIDDMITKSRSLTGTRNPKAKLTENKVRHILKLSRSGMFGTKIAKTIGCNRRTVSNILTGKNSGLQLRVSDMPGKIRRPKHGPEYHIQKDLVEFLRIRGWVVEEMHGNAFQRGIPDLYLFKRGFGERWVDVKHSKRYSFTKAQRIKWPAWDKAGIGIWILTAATQEEYDKLFAPPNWLEYWKPSWVMPTEAEIDALLDMILEDDDA